MTTLKTKTHKEERKERENQIFEEKESLRLSPNNRPTKQFHEWKGRKKEVFLFFPSVRRTFLLPQFRELKKRTKKQEKKNLNRKFLRSICKLQTMKLIKKKPFKYVVHKQSRPIFSFMQTANFSNFPTESGRKKNAWILNSCLGKYF